MSSEEKSHQTMVLLPGARVTLFTRDTESKDAFMALAQDWRFARVGLEVKEGDVDTAIAAFQSETSPELVLVQSDKIDNSFSGKLEALAGSCAAGTAAIVIGPVNDVNLYRKLVGMGVSDYLVRPLKTATLANDIAATLLNKMGAGESRLIALLGAKGGVGTTVLAEGMAWGLAGKLDQKTFLLDAAGGWSTLSVGMNFEPTTTLAEAVRAASEGNEDSFGRMMFTPTEKLTVLSSGGDVMLEDIVQPEGYEALLNHIMTTYPVVVADLSGSPAALRRAVLTRAHEIVIVTTPVLTAIRAARTLLQEIKQMRGANDTAVDIVINMAGLAPKVEVPKAQIEEGLDRKVAGTIDFSPDLFVRNESEGRKLIDDKEGAEAVEILLKLARKVVSVADSAAATSPESTESKSGLGRIMSKLKAKS
jgi:pilus assembly protein CpaE